MYSKWNRPLLALLLCVFCSCAFAQEIVVTPAKAGGVYRIGEPIVWRVEVKGDGAAAIQSVAYVLRKGNMTDIGKGNLTLMDGAATLSAKLDEPGTVYAEFSAKVADKTVKTAVGAVADPPGIKPSAPEPADFDAFWKSKIAELDAVPVNPVLEKGDSGKEGVDYWKIQMDNIRGTKIRGQLARPASGAKFPALLIVQWAGVYPLAKDWATGRAREGWLTLNLNAHDLPIDEPKSFYDNLNATTLKGYPAIGNDDRDQSYFLRMYLSCYRAAEYLASRPDWDGRTLAVMGTSQGGMQALMIGGLSPRITAVLANVPAGCDLTGPMVGRQGGWPNWYYSTQGKDAAKVIETSKYYDAANFAARIKGPALVSAGLIDTTCPPAGVIAAVNRISGAKELLVLEHSDHHGRNNAQAAFWTRSNAWLAALAAGKPAPVASPVAP